MPFRPAALRWSRWPDSLAPRVERCGWRAFMLRPAARRAGSERSNLPARRQAPAPPWLKRGGGTARRETGRAGVRPAARHSGESRAALPVGGSRSCPLTLPYSWHGQLGAGGGKRAG
jgi:hypothetical protein